MRGANDKKTKPMTIMKNQTLIPILLPTEDVSPIISEYQLFIDSQDNKIYTSTQNHYDKNVLKYWKPQHIYLTSDAPVPDIQYTRVYPNISTYRGKYYYHDENKVMGEILFTTDPKLIADGVPAIDGNTKAFVKDTDPLTEKDFLHPVNFFSEFCKRYNQKDNQKVDVEKLANDYQYKKGLDNKGRIAFRDGYNQALQSKAGFSLEDMRKCWNEAGDWFEEKAPARSFDAFIQSLTKETPKGEIVIELNEGKLIFR